MAEAKSVTSDALLVDYVTPIPVISLFKALRPRHVLVAASISTSIALQVVTVLSTGLFDMEYLRIGRNTLISQIDSITRLAHDFSTISASPDLTIYSVQNTNLSYPEGTNAFYAVPKLSYPAGNSAPSQSQYEVHGLTFYDSIQCDIDRAR